MDLLGDYQNILGWRQTTEMAQKLAITDFRAAQDVFNGSRELLDGTTVAEWDVISNERTTAPYTTRGSSATSMDPGVVGHQYCQLSHIFLKIHMDEGFLHLLREPGMVGDGRIEKVQAKIRKEQERLVQKIMFTREKAMWDLLQGTLTVNQLTDEQNTVSYSISIDVLTDTDFAGSPAISWANAATKIVSDEINISIPDQYQAATGYDAERAYCNNTVLKQLMQNTEVYNWYKEANNKVLEQNLKSWTIGGVTFNRFDRGTVASGTLTKFIADNRAILMPEGNPMQARIFECTKLVPNAAGTGLDKTNGGIYSYLKVTEDPVGVTLFVGDDFLPVIGWPELIMNYTTA